MSFLDDTGEVSVAPSPFINLMEIVFPVPITNSLMGLFGDPKRLPAESRDALTAAKTARDKIVSSIGARLTGDPDILISNCQEYAKICVQLAVTQQAGLIAETFSPPAEEFVWTSNLSEGERGGNWSNPFVSFECLFAFVAVAAAYTRKASTTVFADPSGPTLLEASRLYRTAAGYLDFALNNVVPTLRNRGSAKYPSEVQTPVLQALSAVCMAQAQQCAILKSDADGKPKSLLAKLEAGLQTQYADALRCLNSLPPEDMHAVNSQFVAYVRIMSIIASAMSWRHLAEEEYAKMEVGKALGYINKAAAGFARAGDVSFAARGPTGFAALRAQAADIARLQKVYLDDANMVYFVGPSTDIPDAQAAIVVKQIPLDFPMPSSLALPPPLSAPAAEEPPPPITLAKNPSLSVLSGPEPVSPSVTAGGLHVGPGGYPTAPLPAAVPPAPAGPRPAAPSGPAAAAASGMLTIPCASCRQNMLVPLGAPAARCPACSKITRISKCKKCSGGFIFPEGTLHVQCPGCKTINDTLIV